MGKIQRMAAEKTLAILGGGETVKGTLINTPTLETGRLILRKFTERDLEWLFLILHDKEVNQFLPWYPIDSIEEAKKFYEERYASKYVQPQAYAYAICLKTDDHPIGYIKVDMEEHHDFGYGLRREFWHQGLVTEAGKAVIAQVKKDGLPKRRLPALKCHGPRTRQRRMGKCRLPPKRRTARSPRRTATYALRRIPAACPAPAAALFFSVCSYSVFLS